MSFLALYIFGRLFWGARETLVKQPPGFMKALPGQSAAINLFKGNYQLLRKKTTSINQTRPHFGAEQIDHWCIYLKQ